MSKKEFKHTLAELQEKQSLPLALKVRLTKVRIRDWINEFGEDSVYVSFSGGKDSTVLLDLVRQDYPNVKAMFVDTGLEFPEIRQFVRLFDNVDVVRPKMKFREVIEKYGYPMLSKETSECVDGAKKYLTRIISELESAGTNEDTVCQLTRVRKPLRTGISNNMKPTEYSGGIRMCCLSAMESDGDLSLVELMELAKTGVGIDATIKNGYVQKLLGTKGWGKNPWVQTVGIIPSRIAEHDNKSMYSQDRWLFMLDAPFNISNQCCMVMKKNPAKQYGKDTGREMPFTAQMASESRLRTMQWLMNGCNAFDGKKKVSNPMSFWTEQDVLLYLRENHDRMLAPLKKKNPNQKHPWASVYGEIVTDDEESGQISLFPIDAENRGLFDLNVPELHTTGEKRTGCIFCGFGCHLSGGRGKFERLKETHPKLYKYVVGGEFGYRIYSHDGSEVDLRHVDADALRRWVMANEDNKRFKIVWDYPPKNGLGYAQVIDWMNRHGGLKIRY